MTLNNRLSNEELLSIVNKHYPMAEVVEIEDLSSGCDNWIFCLTLAKNSSQNELDNQFILRLPRKLFEPDCPPMHFPKLQAYILDILGENSIPCPKLMGMSSNYLIESFVRETDLSKVVIKSIDNLRDIYTKMGFYTKRMHSIECCHRFGYIIEMDTNEGQLIGKYDNWLQMFENEFPHNLSDCLSKELIDQDQYQTIDQLYIEVKPYLKSYSEPKLLHSDICANNTRVVFNREQNRYEFSGFIDFADCMSGDPLFDLGELLLSSFGDYSVIEMFQFGYGVLSTHNKLMIKFYAIHYNLWLLSSSVLSKDTDKWLQTLHKLISL